MQLDTCGVALYYIGYILGINLIASLINDSLDEVNLQ